MYQTSLRLQQFYKKHFKMKVQEMKRLGTHKCPLILYQDTSSEFVQMYKSDVTNLGGGGGGGR